MNPILQTIAPFLTLLILLGVRHSHPKHFLTKWIVGCSALIAHQILLFLFLRSPTAFLPALIQLASVLALAHPALLLLGWYELTMHRPFRSFSRIHLITAVAFVSLIPLAFIAFHESFASPSLLPILFRSLVTSVLLAIGVGVTFRSRRRSPAFRIFTAALATASGAYGLFFLLGLFSEPVRSLFPLVDSAVQIFLYVGMVLAIFDDGRESAALAASQIEHLAYHDSLTGLPNRALFFDRLILTLAQAHRYKYQCAVIFFDLDRFKSINDSLGHSAGDAVLRAVARRVRETLRLSDTLARLGGDEFTILIPRIDRAEDPTVVAGKILSAVREPILAGERELVVTTSVGVAIFPADGEDAESLVRNADTAMYQAKDQGRDNYQLYAPAMNAGALAELDLESQLRKAIDQGELELRYQPLIDIKSHSVFGFEALVRCRHPELGLISPERFIPTAEVSGLICPLGQWVLVHACHQAKAWQEFQKLPLVASVVLSPRQLQQPDLIEMVQSVLEETQLSPGSLELEITENHALQNAEANIAILSRLKNLGVRISIDDFSFGQTSLTYLEHFPIDTVKLDRAFIRDIEGQGHGAIASAVIATAHGLGLKVIAEGVETERQLNFLGEKYCDLVQGYLFAAPLTADEFGNFLRQHSALISPRSEQSTWQIAKVSGSREKKALVVDDDSAIRNLVGKILERGNFEVETAKDGRDAIEKLQQAAYSVIFLDIMMPHIDGFGVIEYLKNHQPEWLQRVIVMSAIAPDALRKIAAEPIARVVAKPFDVTQLIAVANECVWASQRAS